MVARADSATGQRLLSLAHSLSLEGELEYIPISGMIDLNRENLVVVCGPKTSPVTARALDPDPRLSFDELSDGRWIITDRATGQQFVSPLDNPDEPRAADVAYLGRIPRPDGHGSFLYVAGVHAVGSLGAAEYLADHLAELYDSVGTREFSMVVESRFDPDTEEVTETRALTSPLPWAD
jgi:hypothetical protein